MSLLGLIVLGSAWALPFGKIPVQGSLETGDGATDGVQSLTIGLYPSPGAPDALHEETLTTAVVGGGFSVLLGSSDPLDLALLQGDDALWITVEAGGQESGRVEVGTVPRAAWAVGAGHALTADAATTAVNATHAATADAATEATHATSADSATNADFATTAGSATNATNATFATSAGSAATATSAGTATTLQGKVPADFLASTWRPAWGADITGVPASLANGVTVGTGLKLVGTAFAADFGDTVTQVAAGSHQHAITTCPTGMVSLNGSGPPCIESVAKPSGSTYADGIARGDRTWNEIVQECHSGRTGYFPSGSRLCTSAEWMQACQRGLFSGATSAMYENTSDLYGDWGHTHLAALGAGGCNVRSWGEPYDHVEPRSDTGYRCCWSAPVAQPEACPTGMVSIYGTGSRPCIEGTPKPAASTYADGVARGDQTWNQDPELVSGGQNWLLPCGIAPVTSSEWMHACEHSLFPGTTSAMFENTNDLYGDWGHTHLAALGGGGCRSRTWGEPFDHVEPRPDTAFRCCW